ncbi:cyclophilin-like fold protein [Comamonas testosteroni]|uniref:cyclophilin-like fold protein n=1 Tax=Comamonas testosteroni TaxID=285 RepID=UPI0039196ACD
MKKPAPTLAWRREMLALLIGSCLGLAACTPGNSDAQTPAPRMPSKDSTMKIRLIVGEQVATATLYDNATARDFASLLPLTLTMEDYDTIERVSSLPRKLSTLGAPEGMAPAAGELTHYAPWGNLAIFIKLRSYSRSLLPLGKVDEGLSILSRPGPYMVHIERVEP